MESEKPMQKLPGRASLLAVLLPTFLAVSCQENKTHQKPLTPVRVEQVQIYRGGGGVRYSANIVPDSQVDLAFKSGGYIQSILQVKDADGRMRDVQGGDSVSKGTVVARVREDDYAVRVTQAGMQLAQARASLDAARSQLDEARVAHTQAELDFTRAKNLFATQSLTKPDYDAAKARLDATQARVAAAGSQIEALQAQVGAAQEGVKAAEIPLADTALRAPMDAVVFKRTVDVGSLVGPGTTGFVLADTSTIKVVFGVPDTMME
ncbi:MAG: HlyD family secretion protein, partial [Acidobacteriota bacterium]